MDRRCFVIQPFDDAEFDQRYDDVYKPAIYAAGFKPYRLDRDPSIETPSVELPTQINIATICFADITFDNANVAFELGIAQCLHKPLCLICSEERQEEIPFDYRHCSVIRYNKNSSRSFDSLSDAITEKIKSITQDHIYTQNEPIRGHLHDEEQIYDQMDILGMRAVGVGEASNICSEHLEDESIEKIVIIAYTNEGEENKIKFRSSKNKKIEILKRSMISELAEQQRINLHRIAKGSNIRRWRKVQRSRNISDSIHEYFDGHERGVEITEYFYPSSPRERVYIFDKMEAILGFYHRIEDPLKEGGSIYKGLVRPQSSHAIHISNKTKAGQLLIEQLIDNAEGLKRQSHRWSTEKRAFCGRFPDNWRRELPSFNPSTVLFDLDGVLYDTLPTYFKAWKLVFSRLDIELPEEEIYLKEGIKSDVFVDYVMDKFGKGRESIDQEEKRSIIQEKTEFLKSSGKPKIHRNAKDLVNAVRESGLAIGFVTGSSREGIVEQLQADFGRDIEAEDVITGNDVSQGKPNPEPFFKAIQKFGVARHETIVVENSPLGVNSAVAAGAFCIAINSGPLSNASLMESGARAVFSSCTDLAQRWNEVVSELRV